MITQNPFIGRSRKSAGGMTATTWKGKNVMKTKPVTVANPNTIPQQNQRVRLALLVAFYQLISAVVKKGFKEMAIGMSEFNAFTSKNLLDGSVTSAAGVASFVPSEFKISKGTIGITPIDSVTAVNGDNDASINYDGSTIPANGSLSDKAIVAIFNSTTQVWACSVSTATRADGSVTISGLATLATSNSLKVYLGFVSSDGRKASNSVFFAKSVTA